MAKVKANKPGCDTGLDFKACSITFTFRELLALKAQLLLGRMWTPEEHQTNVLNVLGRIAKKLTAGGYGAEVVERLTKL